MFTTRFRLLSCYLITSLLAACGAGVQYIDDDFPGTEPRLFAEDIVNVPGRLQQSLTMSPSGDEYYFTETSGEEWRYLRILRARRTNGTVALDTPRFVTDFRFDKEWFIGEPMLSADNDQLFFVANYPPDLFVADRLPDGNWSTPVRHPLSTTSADWYPTFSGSDLLFTNGTIYRSRLTDGDYETKERLRAPVNDFDMRDPVMDSARRLLIFTKEVDKATGQTDLYVSFKVDEVWKEPLALDTKINTEEFEFAPYISPDGKFLFFSRRDTWQNASFSNIYWVDIDAVNKLMP